MEKRNKEIGVHGRRERERDELQRGGYGRMKNRARGKNRENRIEAGRKEMSEGRKGTGKRRRLGGEAERKEGEKEGGASDTRKKGGGGRGKVEEEGEEQTQKKGGKHGGEISVAGGEECVGRTERGEIEWKVNEETEE